MRRELKILFVSQVFGKQAHGPSRKLELLRKALQHSNEIELRVLTEDSTSLQESDFLLNFAQPIRPLQFLSKYWRSQAYLRQAQLIYQQWAFDVIIFNDAPKAYATLKLKERPYKVIAMLNDTNSTDMHRRSYESTRKYTVRRILAWLERKVAQSADLVICPSKYLSELAFRTYSLVDLPSVLRPAIDLSEWEEIKPIKVDKEKKTLLFVKSDPHRGGLEVLMKALEIKELSTKYEHLIIGGLDQAEEMRFSSIPFKSSIKLEWRGRLNRVQFKQAILDSDVGVVPSLHEAYSITTSEFAAGGLTVVASNAEGIPEGAESFALFFESANSESLATALSKAADQKRKKVELNYGHLEMASKLKDLLTSL